MTKYTALEGGWFKPGTFIELVANCGDAGGVFAGTRICEGNPGESHDIGEEYEDEEFCPWDEVLEIE